jgi:hypothetical protein
MPCYHVSTDRAGTDCDDVTGALVQPAMVSTGAERRASAHEAQAACDLATAVLADPPVDPYSLLLARWHPCLESQTVRDLEATMRVWRTMRIDARAFAAVCAHVAQRFVTASALVWESEVNQSMRTDVEAWWAATYGEGSEAAVNIRDVAARRTMHPAFDPFKCAGAVVEPAAPADAAVLAHYPLGPHALSQCSHVVATALGVKGRLDVVIAAQLGLVRRVEAAVASGQALTCKVAAAAAEAGSLACLTYVRDLGCAWNELTCSAAARGGHLECLRYAHEHGCPWDAHTCSEAAANDQLACLRYAHEHGCAWTRGPASRQLLEGRSLACAMRTSTAVPGPYASALQQRCLGASTASSMRTSTAAPGTHISASPLRFAVMLTA